MSYQFGEKQKTLSIGAYPAVSLADARSTREAAKEKLQWGVDPAMADEKDTDRKGRVSDHAVNLL
jgi:hypothetical protein